MNNPSLQFRTDMESVALHLAERYIIQANARGTGSANRGIDEEAHRYEKIMLRHGLDTETAQAVADAALKLSLWVLRRDDTPAVGEPLNAFYEATVQRWLYSMLATRDKDAAGIHLNVALERLMAGGHDDYTVEDFGLSFIQDPRLFAPSANDDEA